MNTEWFAKRLFELRNEKNISARDMSLSLGQSESYINKIENRKALPSMNMFFYICEYLQITPEDFFNEQYCKIKKINEIEPLLNKFSPVQLDALMNFLDTINK